MKEGKKKLAIDYICTSIVFLTFLIMSFVFDKNEGKAELISRILFIIAIAAVCSNIVKVLIQKYLSSRHENSHIFIIIILVDIAAVIISLIVSLPCIRDLSSEPKNVTISVSKLKFSFEYKYKRKEYYIGVSDSDEKYTESASTYDSYVYNLNKDLSGIQSVTVEYFPNSKVVYKITEK